LSRGNTEDLAKMYAKWLGAEPSIEPMLRHRGLIPSNGAKSRDSKPAAESVGTK
jgi:peptidyl-dipeptidase Dcp